MSTTKSTPAIRIAPSAVCPGKARAGGRNALGERGLAGKLVSNLQACRHQNGVLPRRFRRVLVPGESLQAGSLPFLVEQIEDSSFIGIRACRHGARSKIGLRVGDAQQQCKRHERAEKDTDDHGSYEHQY